MLEGRILSRILVGIVLCFLCRELSADDRAWNFHGIAGAAPVRPAATPKAAPAPEPTRAWGMNITGAPAPSAAPSTSTAPKQSPIVVKATTVDEDEDPYLKDPLNRRERDINKLLEFKTGVYKSSVTYPEEWGKYGEKNVKEAKALFEACMTKGLDLVQKLIDEKVLVAGHPKTIYIADKWKEMDITGGMILDCNMPYEKLRDAFKDPSKIPPKETLEKWTKDIGAKYTQIGKKTGIAVTVHNGPFQQAMTALGVLDGFLQNPEVLKKAILQVSLVSGDSKAQYDAERQTLTLNLEKPQEWEQFVRDNVKDKADILAPEIEKLIASTTNESVRKTLQEIADKSKAQSTDAARENHKLNAAIEEKFGWPVYLSGRIGDKPLTQPAIQAMLTKILAIPKDQIKGDPYVTGLSFDNRDSGYLSANGSLHFDDKTTTEQFLDWINKAPDKKIFESSKKVWYAELKEISKHFSQNRKDAVFTPDFESTNGLEDFPKAIALFQKMKEKGYCLKKELKVVYFTGSRVSGWAGARNWDAKAIVVRADAKEEHLTGKMDAEGKTVDKPDPEKVYFSKDYCN